jgi:hypothetical protein
LYADAVAVLGPSAREVYVWKGVPEKRILHTGLAYLDAVHKETRPPEEAEEGEKANRSAVSEILFVTENLPQHLTLRALHATIDAASSLRTPRLTVRVHPRESILPYQNLSSCSNLMRVRIDQDNNLAESFHQASLVVLSYSAVGVEAIMAGRDLVVYDFVGANDIAGYVGSGAALMASNETELSGTIMKIATDPTVRRRLAEGRKRFIRKHMYGADGSASREIAKALEAMTKTASHPNGPRI